MRIIEAERAYRRALNADPKDSAASLALSQLLIERGDLRRAKGILMQALQRSTLTLKRIQVLTALVRVIEEQGDPSLALRYVNSALSVASNPVDRARLLETRARLQEKSRTR
jgi:Tfp pilus assembly protein PilF